MSVAKTITVTGAGGQIGYALLFRIAAGEMLGADTPVRLKLLEIPAGMRSAEAAAMELDDCAFPLLESVEVTDDPNVGFADTQIALLVGARPRTAGMERADLLQANASIFRVQGAALNAHAAPDVRVLVVGNPANTNALLASSAAPDIPTERFSAMTRLDHNRALSQLAQVLGCRTADIHNLVVWGNHSATQFPDVTFATVGEVPVLDALAAVLGGPEATERWLDETFMPAVAKRGAEIIAARGASSAASAANGAIDHVRDEHLGTGSDWTSASLVSTGWYGVPEGLVCSVPVRSTGDGFRAVDNLELNPRQQRLLQRSVAELVEERAAAAALGLLG